MRILTLLLMLLLLPALLGCAGLADDSAGDPLATVKPAASEQEEPPAPIEYPVAPFTGDSLYQLLAAEIAGFRNHHQLALDKYIAVAEATRDPGVAARATRLALYMQQPDKALSTAQIWVREAPDEREAHHVIAELLLQKGQLVDAITHLRTIWALGDQVRFDIIAYSSANLAPVHRAAIINEVASMLDERPGDVTLNTALAILLDQQGEYEVALTVLSGLPEMADNSNRQVLHANLLYKLNQQDAAWQLLEDAIALASNPRPLRATYARLLAQSGDMQAAREQYELMLLASPDDVNVAYSLAIITLSQQDDESAKGHLEKLIRLGNREGEAHYYLGGIAERAGDRETALREYRLAGSGYEMIPAIASYATILADESRLPEARAYIHQMRQKYPPHRQQLMVLEANILTEHDMEVETFTLLDDLLSENPDDINLLFTRALTALEFERLDIMETDLRRIITLDPGNADAMNTLGYTLTDLTDRHLEALTLIEGALAIKPNEAAFIDSLGWVQYRLQNYAEALVHLRRALDMFQNDEIAAHLGEVLWVTGQRDEASRVWDEALEFAPESEILMETINRLRGQ